MSETIPIPDTKWTEGLEGGTYVSLGSEPVTVKFDQANPYRRENKWGKPAWDWDVTIMENGKPAGARVLSTTSRRLLRALAGYAPLGGAILTITRKGDGMETEYRVTVAE